MTRGVACRRAEEDPGLFRAEVGDGVDQFISSLLRRKVGLWTAHVGTERWPLDIR